MTTTPNRIEIPAFPQGKRIAVTTSWDDGRVYDRWVVEVLNALGMKGTFNLNSGFLGRTGIPEADDSGKYLDASEVAALYAGHEVAIHSVSHPHLEQLDAAQLAFEVLNDRLALEELVGYPVRGMAYPFGTCDPRVIETARALGVVYSRTVASGVHQFPPAEPLAWGSTMHVLAKSPAPLPEYWESYYQGKWSRGVFYLWGHSYEFAETRDALMRLFTPLAHKPDVWYCTNIELFDYEAARQRLVIAANRGSVYNPSTLPVTIAVDGVLREVAGGLTEI